MSAEHSDGLGDDDTVMGGDVSYHSVEVIEELRTLEGRDIVRLGLSERPTPVELRLPIGGRETHGFKLGDRVVVRGSTVQKSTPQVVPEA